MKVTSNTFPQALVDRVPAYEAKRRKRKPKKKILKQKSYYD